jgi:hypothetical protein
MPTRVQLSRAKGWRMPENTVKVDRTTKWGNPFTVGVAGTRARCVQLFDYMCGGYFCISRAPTLEAQGAYITMAKRDLHELRGRNLACWCPLDQPCHADALLRAANHGGEPC